MLLHVNTITGSPADISNVEIIGSFSVDGNKKYLNDLSQLKYYKEPADIKNVDINLDDLGDTVTRLNTHDKLDLTLTWILDNIDILKMRDFEKSGRWLQPEFIMNHQSLILLLMTPYSHNDWIICASKFKGTIYMCSFYTEEREAEMLNESELAKRRTAWGFKFEQYMRSDSPNVDPDPSAPLNINEEFRCVFKSEIDNKTLLYTAEIDGVCTKEVITDTLVGKNLEFVELNTLVDPSLRDERAKIKYPLLRWWAQSYTVNINNIVCGHKNENGRVKSIMKYKLNELTCSIKDKETRCKSFCNQILEYMKQIVENDYDRCSYLFQYNAKYKTIEVTSVNLENSRYVLLHPQYIEQLRNHFE